MKKVLTMVVCVLALTSFSFFKNAQINSLRKLGKNLYSASSTTSLKAADQEKLKAIFAKQYGIKSFTETTTVHYVADKGTKRTGNAMAEQKVSAAFFQQSMIEDGEPEEVTQRNMFSLDKTNPAIGDIAQVLSVYNVH
ncbi:hypothetical protein [Mucilaginibacter gilvus]|uniref:Uncharacterized protein n=1 Tax=Mucilaginibacter gilvus TaxID=2305909 RepID=A0A444MR37_9SPHI|nr:hypothetical protein [Mucilaginibacter gilvus]RWY54069.1 hypothetical protein EPL05_08465 [Mucilaginibacter gilvus]